MSLALLLATELAEDVRGGFEVYGVSAPGPYVGDVEALGVTHVAVPDLSRSWDLRRDAAAARSLTRVVRELRPDVLHTHTPKSGVLGRVIGRATRVPVVVNTCHGLWAQPGDPAARRWLVYAAEALASRFSHFELFQNDDDRRALRWAVPDHRCRVVGNGVDLELFRFDPVGRAKMRADLGVGDDELVVGGVGRRVAEKGIGELAAVARALDGRARFVWVGPTDSGRSDAGTADLDGLVFLPARPRQDMPAVYSALDVFVLPSHREGFSRSAMEAAACRRPMVLSDIRGCRELGTDTEHLVLVPPRNPQALLAAVRRLLDEPAARGRLGQAAEQRARTAFDQRAVARASIEAYREVARRRGLGW